MMLDYGFGTLNLNRVWLQVYASHAPAIRVEDGVLMGILRSEWKPLTLPAAGDREPSQ
jgi:RimJ/RimL family protein N-acetyltransferase